ncbi:hypothetical protein ES703_16562 [subsurface metagenome]
MSKLKPSGIFHYKLEAVKEIVDEWGRDRDDGDLQYDHFYKDKYYALRKILEAEGLNQTPNQTAKNEGVLFHCYKCEMDMIRIEDRDGEPAFQCPKCLDVVQFDITPFDILLQSFEQDPSG